MSCQALIFDVDGTLAETEEAHRQAFNETFQAAGLDWHWDTELYSQLLAVAGGKERMHHYMSLGNPVPSDDDNVDEWLTALQRKKTARYAELVASGQVTLRPGVERLIREAHQAGIRLAIATTTSQSNITALFKATLGLDVLDWFEVIGAGEQVTGKKPDPEVYQWVLKQLDLPAAQCLAIEDTYNGVQAATGAGIPVLVTPSAYSINEDFSGALAVISDLGEPDQPYQVLTGIDDKPNWVYPELINNWLASASKT